MISAVPPREYGDRFLAFIKSSIRGNDVSMRPQMFEHEPKHHEAASSSEKHAAAAAAAPAPSQGASADPEKGQQGRQEMQEAAGAPAVVQAVKAQ